MPKEYIIEGWGKGPLDELYKLQQSDSVKVISDTRKKKFFPILDGDNGEEAVFMEITILYEGELW